MSSFNDILRNIIKQQNAKIINAISKKYDRNYEELEKKYLTPSYYSIDIDSKKIYAITYSE
jgi:phosphoglucomutase